MKLSRVGEFGLIEILKAGEKRLRLDTVVGIGDDCAVIKPGTSNLELHHISNAPKSKSQNYLLLTTDTFIENVHFKLKKDQFYDVGFKAMAANISDIAAMGGWPTHALVTIGLPSKTTVKQVKQLYRGINQLAAKHKIDIIGGDTISSPREVVVSITLLGEVEKENLLLRSGANKGDVICVTGRFGGPAAKKFKVLSSKLKDRVYEARRIAKSKIATSMIDSSDGLVRSVIEICRSSKVGARIFEEEVPIAKGASLAQALYGGEEYELVFTVPRKQIAKIGKLGFKVTIVGEIVAHGSGIKLIDKHDKIKPLRSGGYEHFK